MGELMSIFGGLALVAGIFGAGFFGEQARIEELELAIAGGAL